MNNNLLLIFVKNPILGNVKTRLAKSIGNTAALTVYKQLLAYTMQITKPLNVCKQVYYDNFIDNNDIWDNSLYAKKMQEGNNLGQKMNNAFKAGFENGYNFIVIIGSDIFDLNACIIEKAFNALKTHEVVFGPAEDGGYYLLGLQYPIPQLFENKQWSTNSVLKDSLLDVADKKIFFLPTLNDIDTIEDLNKHDVVY